MPPTTRQQGGGRRVTEGLVHPEQEQRGQNYRDANAVSQDRRRQELQDRHPHQPGGDDDRAPVEPVGDHAGIQAEHQPGQPLQERGHRHRQRIVRLRRDQQRAGRQSDPIAEVCHPR
ncbi:MAG TPA: hypothetical protein VGM53_19170 [Streptosporangiaceae bacterium]|jgi:hypothetical protein